MNLFLTARFRHRSRYRVFLFDKSACTLIGFPITASVLSVQQLARNFSSAFSSSIFTPSTCKMSFHCPLRFGIYIIYLSRFTVFTVSSPASMDSSASYTRYTLPFPEYFRDFYLHEKCTFSPFISTFIKPALFPFILPSYKYRYVTNLFMLIYPPARFVLFYE